MRIVRAISILFACVLIAGCASTATTGQPLEANLVSTFRYGEVSVVSAVPTLRPEDVARLQQLVAARLSGLQQGATPVTVHLTVTEFSVQTEAARFAVGALAGANRMTARVRIVDGAGQTLREFDVQRSENPGAVGAFTDQNAATINAVADGVGSILSGQEVQNAGAAAINVDMAAIVGTALPNGPLANVEVSDARSERLLQRTAFGQSLGNILLSRSEVDLVREMVQVLADRTLTGSTTAGPRPTISCEIRAFLIETPNTLLYWDVKTSIELVLRIGNMERTARGAAVSRTYVFPTQALTQTVTVDAFKQLAMDVERALPELLPR